MFCTVRVSSTVHVMHFIELMMCSDVSLCNVSFMRQWIATRHGYRVIIALLNLSSMYKIKIQLPRCRLSAPDNKIIFQNRKVTFIIPIHFNT